MTHHDPVPMLDQRHTGVVLKRFRCPFRMTSICSEPILSLEKRLCRIVLSMQTVDTTSTGDGLSPETLGTDLVMVTAEKGFKRAAWDDCFLVQPYHCGVRTIDHTVLAVQNLGNLVGNSNVDRYVDTIKLDITTMKVVLSSFRVP